MKTRLVVAAVLVGLWTMATLAAPDQVIVERGSPVTVNGGIRVGTGGLTYSAVTFATLGSSPDGTVLYCSDCTFANPCAGSGTGAIAKRLAGAWRCD